jgi:outer membrane lipoprotein carrier protein
MSGKLAIAWEQGMGRDAKQPKRRGNLEIGVMPTNVTRPTSRKSSPANSKVAPRLRARAGFAALGVLVSIGPVWSRSDDSASLAQAQQWIRLVADPLQSAKKLEIRFRASVLTAEGESQPGYQGVLYTAENHAFRMEIPAGTYVSDGSTFWEYHPSTQQAIVKSAQAISGKSLPARMLLDYLSATPLSCDTLASGKTAAVRIALRPGESATHLDSLEIRIGLKSRQWQSVATLDVNGMRTTYTLQKYRSLNSLPARTFSFSPPKGVEVVDMR